MDDNGIPRLAGESLDLSLLVQDDAALPCGRSLAFVIPSWQVSDDFQGEVMALASALLEPGADAFDWFSDMDMYRPWETRH